MKKFLIIAAVVATLGFTAAYACGTSCCSGGKAKDKGASVEKPAK